MFQEKQNHQSLTLKKRRIRFPCLLSISIDNLIIILIKIVIFSTSGRSPIQLTSSIPEIYLFNIVISPMAEWNFGS